MMRAKMCGNHGWTRRHFLFGSCGTVSLTGLATQLRAQGSGRPRSTAKACIFVNLVGGASQMDTFDAKDGPWNQVDVNLQSLPGGLVMSGRYFPKLTRLGSEIAVIRSANSREIGHDRGRFQLQTAHRLNPAGATEIPHMGAIIAAEKGTGGKLPPFLAFNDDAIQGAGYLSGRSEPYRPGLNSNGISTLKHLNYSEKQFDDRLKLLNDLDAPLRQLPASDDVRAYADFVPLARNLMYDDSISSVFKYTQEEDARYGSSQLGRSLIVARNAVRANAGVRLVSTTYGVWDQHFLMFDQANNSSHPRTAATLDAAVGALIEDLRSSGHLASTLVLAMGEFGRTPGPLNVRGGRDHYRDAQAILLAGGGMRGGFAIGQTSKDGGAIVDYGWSQARPVYPEDLAATLYSAMGIDWTKSTTNTPSGRLFEFIPGARVGDAMPVEELFR